MEDNHKIAVFPGIYAVDVVQNSRVCATSMVDGSGGVHGHYAAHIVVFIIVKLLGEGAAVCIFHVSQSVIQIHDLIYPRIQFSTQIVGSVQGVNLKGLVNVIRHRGMVPKRFLS